MEQVFAEMLTALRSLDKKLDTLCDQGKRQQDLLQNIAENMHALNGSFTAAVDAWADLQQVRINRRY